MKVSRTLHLRDHRSCLIMKTIISLWLSLWVLGPITAQPFNIGHRQLTFIDADRNDRPILTFAPDEQVSLKLSDFNDLANKSTLGIEAVKRQVGSVIERIIRQNKEQMSQFRTDIAQPDMEGKKQKRALTQ